MILPGLVILLLLLLSTSGRPDVPVYSELLEAGTSLKASASDCPREGKILSYNISHSGGSELKQLTAAFRDDSEIGGAIILGLQEVDRNKKRTGNVNTARKIAETLDMAYAWAAPPPVDDKKEEETGVAIFSRYPMKDIERIVLPNRGPGGRRRAAVGATICICDREIRVYSVHVENRMDPEPKLAQISAVLESLAKFPNHKHAIVLGDLNTLSARNSEETHKVFSGAGFLTPLSDDLRTWRLMMIELRLDWVWLRDLSAVESGVARQITFSDHFPVWARIRFDP
jgi:endonuclease/exonuclease/phosphatase family metal-dependent hydrolase